MKYRIAWRDFYTGRYKICKAYAFPFLLFVRWAKRQKYMFYCWLNKIGAMHTDVACIPTWRDIGRKKEQEWKK
jgi:hypothetical protein